MWGIIAAVLGGAVALAALESATGARLVDVLAVCTRSLQGQCVMLMMRVAVYDTIIIQCRPSAEPGQA